MSNLDENLDIVTHKLREGLEQLELRRILTNFALALFIVINAFAFAQFVVFLVLFIVKTVTVAFNLFYLIMFIIPIIVALFNNLWYLFWVIRQRKKFRVIFKETHLQKALSETFSDCKFEIHKGLEQSVVDSSGIVSSGNEYFSEDLLTGSYRNVQFSRADVRIRYKLEIDGKKSGAALGEHFRGQWMIFDFNKPIEAYVRVVERKGVKRGGPMGAMLSKTSYAKFAVGASTRKLSNIQKVQLEDVEFNRRFEVSTYNPQTAFYILTPHFMEAVKFLERQVGGQLMLAFLDGKLHVAVNNFSSEFEPSLAKNPTRNARMIARQVLKTTKFVDILKLDNDYFK